MDWLCSRLDGPVAVVQALNGGHLVASQTEVLIRSHADPAGTGASLLSLCTPVSVCLAVIPCLLRMRNAGKGSCSLE